MQDYAMQQHALIETHNHGAGKIQIPNFSSEKDHYNGVKFVYIRLEILPRTYK